MPAGFPIDLKCFEALVKVLLHRVMFNHAGFSGFTGFGNNIKIMVTEGYHKKLVLLAEDEHVHVRALTFFLFNQLEISKELADIVIIFLILPEFF